MSDIHEQASQFFDGLNPKERVMVLRAALKRLGNRRLSAFDDDSEVKAYLWLLERLKKFLDGEGYGGYTCDIVVCDKEAGFYNSNLDAFYCEEHN